MKATWRWICDYWVLLAGLLGAIVVGALGLAMGRDLGAGELLEARQNEIEAGRKGKALEAEIGHERAVATIEAEHSATVVEMEAESADRVEKLRRDPGELNRAAVAFARKRRRARGD